MKKVEIHQTNTRVLILMNQMMMIEIIQMMIIDLKENQGKMRIKAPFSIYYYIWILNELLSVNL